MSRKHSIVRGVAAACALTAAGGSMDVCVYLDHHHVFAAAQTGNIVLMAAEAASGHLTAAARHLPPLLAFCAGVVASRVVGFGFKRRWRVLDSRTLRLAMVALALLVLALCAGRMSDAAVTACVAFTAAFQISSYSHLGGWSFNTAMTTGNLWNALSAATKAWMGETGREDFRKAAVLGFLVAAFAGGALVGGWAAAQWRDLSLLLTALLTVGAAMLLAGPAENNTA